MKKTLLVLFTPPFAACRYGCAGCCAAPIGVFWIAGIVGILYGLIWGGPTEGSGGQTALLGLGLWILASVWAALTIRGADEDKCQNRSSTLCSKILPGLDEHDPMDEVRKAR
ncbi:hypothetical protein TspCOW1_11090 [Thiohalobacter sp. COW1]|uniref:Fe-S-cluster oxidoreductase n=1 Tax=Thiohalobacter thiocyanaticus TaxID=585455 RepID=A0A1Z4VQL5_9GAMM|nr:MULTISPECIES: hypothetical protein [Thiohalobacter]BAZ93926.1 Fe-S-cluster oxidoreductase [Thiohalobacter thiocyanaticus]BCO31006.1 hypothetical protein TspCOW1_11090 [Thiohalobacter sp. COW1]